MPSTEPSSSVQDWHRLRAILLRQERQLDQQLRQAVQANASIDELLRQRAQLRAFRELCDTLRDQAAEAHPLAGMRTNTVPPPRPGTAGALTTDSSQARFSAKRAAHTILVVDDHPPTLYAATRLLKRAGYGVMEATTGEQAMLLSPRASALLLDVNLPDINGVAVCQAVKQFSIKPVILMSAVYTDELHQSAGMSAGADLYLTSLLDGNQLASSLDKLLAPSPA